MTTTDQAFIKAYLRDDVQQTPPPPHIPVSDSPTVIESSTTVGGKAGRCSSGPFEVEEIYAPDPALQRAIDPSAPQPADELSAESVRIDEPAAGRVPEPHASFSHEVGGGQGDEDNAPPGSADAAADAAAGGASAAKPLSAFMPDVQASGMFRPALAVDSFLWPTITESLIGQTGDAFAEVAIRLTHAARAGQRVVAITGCRRGEGRTTTLLSIARTLAKLGTQVAMVDADFQQPRLAERLGLAVENGWEAVLRGELPLAEAVVQAENDRLALLPLCEPVGQAEELAQSIQVSIGMGVLRQKFELVLVDLGPLLDPLAMLSALPLAIEARLDAAVLVHDVQRVSADDVAAASQRLAEVGVTTVGILENFTQVEDFEDASSTERTAVTV